MPHILPMQGRMRSFDQGSIRAQRESVAAGNDPKGEAQPSYPSPTTITSLKKNQINGIIRLLRTCFPRWRCAYRGYKTEP